MRRIAVLGIASLAIAMFMLFAPITPISRTYYHCYSFAPQTGHFVGLESMSAMLFGWGLTGLNGTYHLGGPPLPSMPSSDRNCNGTAF